MHKKILFLLTGLIALSISAIPVLASDPPTDDGQYIWQDENGDYWYRNGSEDEYIGEGNYAPDPDSGELMEGNDALKIPLYSCRFPKYFQTNIPIIVQNIISLSLNLHIPKHQKHLKWYVYFFYSD